MKSYLDIFAPIVDKMNIRIVDSKRIGNDLLEITIAYRDNADHVDLETCSKVAHALAEAVDYDVSLDVSSEGAERVIPSHLYETVKGQYIHIKFKQPKDGLDVVEGTLEEISDDVLGVKYRFKHTHKNIDVERENIDLLRLAVKI